MPEASAIDKQVNEELTPKIIALNEPFQEVRSHIGALTYQIEVSHSDSTKNSLRKEIEDEWWLIATGLLSVLFGVLILMFPGAGALGIAFGIGWFAIVYGVLLVGFSWRLKQHAEVKI